MAKHGVCPDTVNSVRRVLLAQALALIACSSSTAPLEPKPGAVVTPAAVFIDAAIYPPNTYADLASALAAVLPTNARVIGFGELHARTDRTAVRSSLSQFTAALPSFGDKVSDLILETFIVDPRCGQTAKATTQKLETEVKRPVETKSEITLLADAAKAANIQPHAMTLTCADYKALAPNGHVDPLAMLAITTRELGRIAASAVGHRDREPDHRPWVVLYGGALHNDLVPDDAVKEWSYAAAIDKLTNERFVEVDLIVPELAVADAKSQTQPWFPLVTAARDRVAVYERSPHSFVIVLPAAPQAAPNAPRQP